MMPGQMDERFDDDQEDVDQPNKKLQNQDGDADAQRHATFQPAKEITGYPSSGTVDAPPIDCHFLHSVSPQHIARLGRIMTRQKIAARAAGRQTN